MKYEQFDIVKIRDIPEINEKYRGKLGYIEVIHINHKPTLYTIKVYSEEKKIALYEEQFDPFIFGSRT